MSRLTIAMLTFAISVLGFLFSLYNFFWTGFLDVRGIVQMLNLFNVVLGGEPTNLPTQDAGPGAGIATLLFAILAMNSFWWLIRELVRRYSGPQVTISI
jgi:hypothetical protein